MATPRAQLDGELLNKSEFIAAVEMAEGVDYPATISNIELKDLHVVGKEKKVRKAVVSFRECKPLVLNRTNEGTIARLYGSNAREWIGRKITMYRTTTKLGRQTVECIRIRDTAPTEQQRAEQPNPSRPVFDAWRASRSDGEPTTAAAFQSWVSVRLAVIGRTAPPDKQNPMTAEEAERLLILISEGQ